MYVAFTALYLGVVLVTNSAWPLPLLPGAWAATYLLVIRREERYLAAAFGDEYDSYRSRVRRWL